MCEYGIKEGKQKVLEWTSHIEVILMNKLIL